MIRVVRCRQAGMTLIELMISTALTSFVILAAAAVLTQATKISVTTSNQNEASADTSAMGHLLHQLIDQSTMVYCNCNSNAACDFDPAEADTTDACDAGRQVSGGSYSTCSPAPAAGSAQTPIVVAAFISETSGAPLSENYGSANCYVPPNYGATGLGVPGVASKIYPRGCKKVFQLVYTRPTQTAVAPGGVASQPGSLEVRDITNWMNGKDPDKYPLYSSPGSLKSVLKISNLSAFRCGFTRDKNATTIKSTMTGFNLFALFKIPNRTPGLTSKNTDTGLTSYHPSDATYNAGNAINRRFSENFAFRNLEQRGRIFGPAQSRPCIKSGAATVVADWRDCCSQHIDAGMKCVANCAFAGSATSVEGMCCSGMLNAAGALCI